MPKKIKLLALSLAVASIFFTTDTVDAQPIDITPPTTTHTLNPATPDGNNSWYVSPVQVQLNATDLESGVKNINYRIDGGNWQTIDFSNTANLAPNASFETSSGSTTTGIANWEGTLVDPEVTYSKDNGNYAPGYAGASAKINATGGTWHGINHRASFAATSPFDNMTSSVWLKTDSVTGTANYRIYAVIPDGSGGYTYQLLTQSATVSGTTDWTLVTLDFTVSVSGATGVYMDIGLSGPGTLWADAATITTSLENISTSFTIASDNAAHTVEYYSTDFSNNVETHSCTSPKVRCIEFKLDQTPPGNWRDSGATRQIGGGSSSVHRLWVFITVDDATSGLSTTSNIYQYLTSRNPTFGHYSNLLGCNSTWNANQWRGLLDGVDANGDTTAQLRTQRTDFCDSNWKDCKEVRFYAEDRAGNIDTKDICLNGPWIKVRGHGHVRANANIDMVSEANEDNTDSLIEVGGNSIEFFTSAEDWRIFNSPVPPVEGYTELYEQVTGTKTSISTGADLVSSTGLYEINGDYTIDNQSTPNNYDSATFNQIVFIEGNLSIDNDIEVSASSTALFIVSGDVYIDKAVNTVGIAIFADGDLYSAYNIGDGEATQTLNLNGMYSADEIKLQRTLQGTQNNDTPAESFEFEPKYMIQLREFFDESTVEWVSRQ